MHSDNLLKNPKKTPHIKIIILAYVFNKFSSVTQSRNMGNKGWLAIQTQG